MGLTLNFRLNASKSVGSTLPVLPEATYGSGLAICRRRRVTRYGSGINTIPKLFAASDSTAATWWEMSIQGRGRDAEALRYLLHGNVGIGQECFGVRKVFC